MAAFEEAGLRRSWQPIRQHTAAALQSRGMLRWNPVVAKALEVWWLTMQRSTGMDVVLEEDYVRLSKMLYNAIQDEYDEEDAETTAREEWLEEMRKNQVVDRLSGAAFKGAIFEIADLMTEEIDAKEYSEFLYSLLADVAGSAATYFWKPPPRPPKQRASSDPSLRRGRPASGNTRQALTTPTAVRAPLTPPAGGRPNKASSEQSARGLLVGGEHGSPPTTASGRVGLSEDADSTVSSEMHGGQQPTTLLTTPPNVTNGEGETLAEPTMTGISSTDHRESLFDLTSQPGAVLTPMPRRVSANAVPRSKLDAPLTVSPPKRALLVGVGGKRIPWGTGSTQGSTVSTSTGSSSSSTSGSGSATRPALMMRGQLTREGIARKRLLAVGMTAAHVSVLATRSPWPARLPGSVAFGGSGHVSGTLFAPWPSALPSVQHTGGGRLVPVRTWA